MALNNRKGAQSKPCINYYFTGPAYLQHRLNLRTIKPRQDDQHCILSEQNRIDERKNTAVSGTVKKTFALDTVYSAYPVDCGGLLARWSGNFSRNTHVSAIIRRSETFKGTVQPDWICMRVVPLESPLKGHQPLYDFDFLISVLNIWNKFWAASCKIEPNLLLVRITGCIESCLPIGWRTVIWWKNPPKCTSI